MWCASSVSDDYCNRVNSILRDMFRVLEVEGRVRIVSSRRFSENGWLLDGGLKRAKFAVIKDEPDWGKYVIEGNDGSTYSTRLLEVPELSVVPIIDRISLDRNGDEGFPFLTLPENGLCLSIRESVLRDLAKYSIPEYGIALFDVPVAECFWKPEDLSMSYRVMVWAWVKK